MSDLDTSVLPNVNLSALRRWMCDLIYEGREEAAFWAVPELRIYSQFDDAEIPWNTPILAIARPYNNFDVWEPDDPEGWLLSFRPLPPRHRVKRKQGSFRPLLSGCDYKLWPIDWLGNAEFSFEGNVNRAYDDLQKLIYSNYRLLFDPLKIYKARDLEALASEIEYASSLFKKIGRDSCFGFPVNPLIIPKFRGPQPSYRNISTRYLLSFDDEQVLFGNDAEHMEIFSRSFLRMADEDFRPRTHFLM